LPIIAGSSISSIAFIVQRVKLRMSKARMTRVSVEIPAELADAIASAAKANNVAAEDIVSDCVRQQFETALRHRVLVQRQNDVDEALLELARLVGRLSAGPAEPREEICRYRSAGAK
jgi:hypothetical protein